MAKYIGHSLQLTPAEEADFQAVYKATGFGVKKIFMAMVKALKPASTEEMPKENNEEY